VITSSDDAKAITDEYQQRMESLAPLQARPAPAAPARPPAQVTPIR
jgi:general secretion pathway protein D